MGRKRVMIRQCADRRLFDVAHGRLLSLEDVAEIVRGRREVKVVAAETGRDVTAAVLSQIIMQSAKPPDPGFPLNILPQVITASGQLSPEIASKYIQAMTAAYQAAFRSFAPQVSPLALVQNVVSMALRSTVGGGQRHEDGPEPEMDELRRKLEELQSELGEQGAAPPAPKPRRLRRVAKTQ